MVYRRGSHDYQCHFKPFVKSPLLQKLHKTGTNQLATIRSHVISDGRFMCYGLKLMSSDPGNGPLIRTHRTGT